MEVYRMFPPNIKKIKKVLTPPDNAVFTYGDKLYAGLVPFELPPDLIAHEEVHSKQQGDDPEAWWDKYLSDVKFRFEQELTAYRVQWKLFSAHKSREQTWPFAHRIARDLASEMYGSIVDFNKALSLIKKI